MNSFALLTSSSSPTPASTPPRSRSASSVYLNDKQGETTYAEDADVKKEEGTPDDMAVARTSAQQTGGWEQDTDEKTPLLSTQEDQADTDGRNKPGWHFGPKRIASAVINGFRVVITTIVAPVRYVVACFYDEDGNFSAFMPLYKLGRGPGKRKRKASAYAVATSSEDELSEKDESSGKRHQRRVSSSSTGSTAIQTDSEAERKDTPAKNTRSKTATGKDGQEAAPSRRSIRIKLFNQEAEKRRQERKAPTSTKLDQSPAMEAAAQSLKSPTGSAAGAKQLTRYPRTPAPPRPLVPKRHASFTNLPFTEGMPHAKTLILDLDETLIHSHAKGGRYTAGHMVEVKMNNAVGVGGTYIGPQVPILYYVHKRPYCDEFLRKVSRWYNLIVFTASVQEYADPVIDWLEGERRYFHNRLYRQHCTQRNGAYIKDLASVEPDLSKVMIIDNSPVSYAFHEDNAIPIEGWISDPTDNGLLHLIPLLEGLQYATDVRAVLSLRMGQPQVS